MCALDSHNFSKTGGVAKHPLKTAARWKNCAFPLFNFSLERRRKEGGEKEGWGEGVKPEWICIYTCSKIVTKGLF